MNYVVPVTLISVFVYGLIKRVNVYDSFVLGAKKSFDLSLSVLPFKLLGVPSEVVELMLLRPFSGSGSLAILTDVYTQYGVDSYVGRCASVIMGSSETVFYVASVYFAGTRVKRTGFAIPIALFCNLVGGVAACLLCKVM